MPLYDMIQSWNFGQGPAQPLGMLGAQAPTQPGSAPVASAAPVGMLNAPPAPIAQPAAPVGMLTPQSAPNYDLIAEQKADAARRVSELGLPNTASIGAVQGGTDGRSYTYATIEEGTPQAWQGWIPASMADAEITRADGTVLTDSERSALGLDGAAPAQNGFMEGLSAVADSGFMQDLSFGLLNGKNWGQAATMAGNRSLEMAPQRRKEAKTQQQVNDTRALLEKKYPQYLPLLDSGHTPNDIMKLVLEDERDAKKEAKTLAERQQLAGLLPEGPGRAAVLAGANFSDIYQSQVGGGTSDWSKLNDGTLFNQRTGETMPIEGYDPAALDPPTLTSVYDENGREQKGYMQGTEFVPVGSAKSQTERAEFNVSQAAAAGYADRMAQSNALLGSAPLTEALMDRTQVIQSGTPVFGNNLVSPAYRQADQAKRDFINATLRRESGAVISPEEFANANLQYFPQPGDDANTLAQKAANRRNTINGVSRAAGPAYETPDTTNYLSGDLNPPAQPITAQDFNSLPSGSEYIDPDDGQLYRRP